MIGKLSEVKGKLKLINEFPIDYVAQQICQLFEGECQAKIDQIVNDDADRCAEYLKAERASCQKRVERMFRVAEELCPHIKDFIKWQVLKKKGMK